MIPDREIWRVANLLIREHRGDVRKSQPNVPMKMLDRGDRDGQLVWLRIKRAIVKLQGCANGKAELAWWPTRPRAGLKNGRA